MHSLLVSGIKISMFKKSYKFLIVNKLDISNHLIYKYCMHNFYAI